MLGKISLAESIKSISAFFIDADTEKEFQERIKCEVREIRQEMREIDTLAGLRRYISRSSESLSRILALLGVSEEKFKRIITMLRLKKNYLPTAEWSISAVRSMMLSRDEWMDEICQLFLNGSQMLRYQNVIPSFYLDNFIIDSSTMRKLNDEAVMFALVKKSMEGSYSNFIGEKYFDKLFSECSSIASRNGLVCTKTSLKFLSRQPSFVIRDSAHPLAVFYVSYNITTSSGQTKFATDIENVKKGLSKLKEESGQSIMLISILDGAGWIARQSDLRTILNASDYLFSVNTIGKLAETL